MHIKHMHNMHIMHIMHIRLCVAAETQGLLASAVKKEQTYITTGYRDWKHALSNFTRHELSATHQLAVQQLAIQTRDNPTLLMVTTGKAKEQEEAQALRVIFDAKSYLSAQGLPLRRRKEETGHFRRYLEKASQRDEVLRRWLSKRDASQQTFMSPEIQKAIQRQLALAVTRSLAEEVSQADFYAVIADETTDAAQKEQLSICLRFVTDSLQVEELFIGLYEAKSTIAEAIFSRCMTARDRLRAWDVKFFGSSNLTHKSYGIFVASWGFAHCICTRLVFHNFLSHRKEDKWTNAKKQSA